VSVTPADGEFGVIGTLFTFGAGNVPDEEWSDSDLHPGPKTQRLRNDRDYAVDVIISFASAAPTTATVAATVVKANGEAFGRPREAQLRGKNGDPPETVTMVLVTA
jgi:hypothetical protein